MIKQDAILNAKLLVVDDRAENVDLLAAILYQAGYTSVSSTTEPNDVFRLHEENRYDLILLDLNMPGMDGFEVMAKLKQIEEDSYLPVLAITAQPRFKIAALEAGARDFITKPYDLVEVRQRIHNILEVRLLYKEVAEYARIHKELALHDALTGLPNRRLLLDRLVTLLLHAKRTQHRIAVMYLDLDGFKAVNDVHGHDCGDKLLIMASERLRFATREEDTIARLGGDEFMVVIGDISELSDIDRPATTIIRELSQPYLIDGIEVSVTASIGVSFYPDDGLDVDVLIRRADQALYEAKHAGKNRYRTSRD
ncbi:MAG: diguanylate cyclase [Pseudomonadota bacterium]